MGRPRIRSDEYIKSYEKRWRQTHRSQRNENSRRRYLLAVTSRHNTKYIVLLHYSKRGCKQPSCKLCGYDDIRALCIDHVNGDGYMERISKKYHLGSSFYIWLKKNHFPKGYQTLCMNCNWIKRVINHEGKRFLDGN